jgi:hypothetical protein
MILGERLRDWAYDRELEQWQQGQQPAPTPEQPGAEPTAGADIWPSRDRLVLDQRIEKNGHKGKVVGFDEASGEAIIEEIP